MNNLRGKNAILTGGSRGIGLYIGRALACEGANLALVALPAEAAQLEAVAQQLAALGASAVAIPADISDEAARVSLVERAKAELGAIDILVNNTGVEPMGRFARQPQEDIVRAIEVNLTATLLLTQRVLPDMLAQRQGHIVTIASMVGKKGAVYSAAYSATKAGEIAWTEGLRSELEGTGVSASVVCPDYVPRAGVVAE